MNDGFRVASRQVVGQGAWIHCENSFLWLGSSILGPSFHVVLSRNLLDQVESMDLSLVLVELLLLLYEAVGEGPVCTYVYSGAGHLG